MKIKLILAGLIYSLLYSTSVHSKAPFHISNKAFETVSIDGQLTESIWRQQKNPRRLTFYKTGKKNSEQTNIYSSWDETYLYFAFQFSDNYQVTNYNNIEANHDAHLYKTDDLIEIFIDPDGDAKNYIELGINFSDVKYDLIIKRLRPWIDDWNWKLEGVLSKTIIKESSKKNSKTITMEVAIPLDQLRRLSRRSDLKKMKFNIYRINRKRKREDNEYLALFPLYKRGFHQPKKFGRLILKAN